MEQPKLTYELELEVAREMIKVLNSCQVPGQLAPKFAGILKFIDSPTNTDELKKYLEYEANQKTDGQTDNGKGDKPTEGEAA